MRDALVLAALISLSIQPVMDGVRNLRRLFQAN
jgi:hypothetical protein